MVIIDPSHLIVSEWEITRFTQSSKCGYCEEMKYLSQKTSMQKVTILGSSSTGNKPLAFWELLWRRLQFPLVYVDYLVLQLAAVDFYSSPATVTHFSYRVMDI